MMAQSVTLVTGSGDLPETWRRFYNGPFFGLIDVEVAEREMPWLVGRSPGVTIDTNEEQFLSCPLPKPKIQLHGCQP